MSDLNDFLQTIDSLYNLQLSRDPSSALVIREWTDHDGLEKVESAISGWLQKIINRSPTVDLISLAPLGQVAVPDNQVSAPGILMETAQRLRDLAKSRSVGEAKAIKQWLDGGGLRSLRSEFRDHLSEFLKNVKRPVLPPRVALGSVVKPSSPVRTTAFPIIKPSSPVRTAEVKVIQPPSSPSRTTSSIQTTVATPRKIAPPSALLTPVVRAPSSPSRSVIKPPPAVSIPVVRAPSSPSRSVIKPPPAVSIPTGKAAVAPSSPAKKIAYPVTVRVPVPKPVILPGVVAPVRPLGKRPVTFTVDDMTSSFVAYIPYGGTASDLKSEVSKILNIPIDQIESVKSGLKSFGDRDVLLTNIDTARILTKKYNLNVFNRNTPYTVTASYTSKVSDLKPKVASLSGLPITTQVWAINNNRLSDDTLVVPTWIQNGKRVISVV